MINQNYNIHSETRKQYDNFNDYYFVVGICPKIQRFRLNFHRTPGVRFTDCSNRYLITFHYRGKCRNRMRMFRRGTPSGRISKRNCNINRIVCFRQKSKRTKKKKRKKNASAPDGTALNNNIRIYLSSDGRRRAQRRSAS